MLHPLREHIEVIIKITDEEFDFILSHFTPVKLKKHAPLIREGELVNHEYFVLKGCLRTYLTDPEKGKEFTLQFAVENWWLSDREALYSGTPAKLNIECLEACELLSITKENREKLGRELWKYEHYMNVKVSRGHVAQQRRIITMISGDARQRYEVFLQQYPMLINRVPKTYIASYLGVSRETISRLYRK